MPKKLPHTGKQVGAFVAHLVIYLIGTAILWYICLHGHEEWVYPWPAWITAAWGLIVVAHACTVWANYEDKGMNEFHRQINN